LLKHIQVMTGNIPFAQYNNWTVIPRIVSGERPARPQISPGLGLTDAVWGLARQCWSQQIDERPVIADVLQSLNYATKYWEPPSSSSEETDDGPTTRNSETRSRGGGNVTETSSSTWLSNTITSHPQHSFDPPRTTDLPFSSLPLPNSEVCSVS
jgi:hypothetical protein